MLTHGAIRIVALGEYQIFVGGYNEHLLALVSLRVWRLGALAILRSCHFPVVVDGGTNFQS